MSSEMLVKRAPVYNLRGNSAMTTTHLWTWWHRLDRNLLFILSLFLVAFIPLYPKIPLGELIPGYQVRLRLEDVVIAFTALVWLRDVVLGRIRWQSLMLASVIGYALVGVASLIFAIFVLQTIPLELLHIGKSGLHYFRYLEYFSLFFFLYSSLRTRRQLRLLLAVICLTMMGVIVYAIGQIYWQWPVYSTMNREYSKGVALTLTEFARVHSTFGGHYDLAAYLLLILPTLYAFLLVDTRWQRRAVYLVLLLAGSWLILETKAKTSVVGAGLGAAVVSLIWFFQQGREVKQKVVVYGVGLCLSGIVLAVFGWFLLPSTVKAGLLTKLETNSYGQTILGFFNQSKNTPSDVQQDLPEYRLVATTSAEGVTTYVQTVGEREWSPNALKYGLSMGIRLDTLWPQALRGWANNLALGNGYATLSKVENSQFTEGDSTDNNYLRVLGELGLLGFLIFFSTVLIVLHQAVRQLRHPDPLISGFALGFVGATIGLLLNAIYIDVFAASKVAFSYWGLAGIVYAAGYVTNKEEVRQEVEEQKLFDLFTFIRSHFLFLLAIIGLLLLNPATPYAQRSLLNELAVSPVGLANITAVWCQVQPVATEICQTLPSRNILDQLYRLWLLPWYQLLRVPASYYYANLTLSFLVTLGLYLGWRRLNRYQSLAGFVALAGVVSITSTGMVYQANLTRSLGFQPGTWLEHFRHQQLPAKHTLVTHANGFFSTVEFKTKDQLFLASDLEPAYVSVYRQGFYQPLSLNHLTLTDLKTRLTGNARVFVSDISRDAITDPFLRQINQELQLKIRVLDCQDRCNIYEVATTSAVVSPTPITISEQPLVLDRVRQPTLAVLPRRFERENKLDTTLKYLTELLALPGDRYDFVVLTGDITQDQDVNQQLLVQAQWLKSTQTPVLYLAGNYDQGPKKAFVGGNQHFFNDGAYFILFTPGPDQLIAEDERLYLYNRWLELEKLPEVTDVYLIVADFAVTESKAFFTEQLLPRMAAQPDKHFHLIVDQSAAEIELPTNVELHQGAYGL